MLGLGGPLGCRPLWTEPSLNSFNSRRVSDDVHLERFLSFTLEVSWLIAEFNTFAARVSDWS